MRILRGRVFGWIFVSGLAFTALFVGVGYVRAQSYYDGCSACTGPGSWCVEAGGGYSCGSPASCGAYVSPTSYCPSGCTCSAFKYIGGNTQCVNNCVRVDSCSNVLPSAPPGGGESTPPPPGVGGCTAPGEFCVDQSWWVNNGKVPITNCGQIGKAGSLSPCTGGYCCSEPVALPPPPPPAPTCSISSTIDANTLEAGESTVIRTTPSYTNTNSWSVTFSTSNSRVATVKKSTARNANVYGEGGGTATITARLVATGDGGSCQATTSKVVNVTAPAWWQVQDGDVVSGGDLFSEIPVSCSLPGCKPYFDLKGSGDYPGVPIYGRFDGSGDFDFSTAVTETGVPAEGEYWLAKSPYNATANLVDYSYFTRQIPSDVTVIPIDGDIQTGELVSQGKTKTRGFVWYIVESGDAYMNGKLNIVGEERIVLLVPNGNLHITKDINIQTPGKGFFMAVVKGDIIVSAAKAGSSSPTPAPSPTNNEPPSANRNCGETCGGSAVGGGLCDGDGDPGTNAPSSCRYRNTNFCNTGTPSNPTTYCAPVPAPTGWAYRFCTTQDTGNRWIDKDAAAAGPQYPTVAELQAACAAAVVPVATPSSEESTSGRVADLDGIYFAEGKFYTGTAGTKDDESLTVRGSIAAMGGIVLQRDLGSVGNSTTPAELFIYSPEMLSTFPREFFRDKIVWQEVAP